MLTTNYFAKGSEDAKAFWRIHGEFGESTGEVKREGNALINEAAGYRVKCEYEKNEYDVFTRRDSFENISDQPLTVDCLRSRFVFEGGEYEVYTQFNDWQAESSGCWQPLVTNVSVSCQSTRSTQDGTPMMVLWSQQAQRGVVFQLLPDCAWEIKASHIGLGGKNTATVVELGIQYYNFKLTLAPGEVFKMPEIICYETKNRVDLDCYKLHHYVHQRFPRKKMPVIYNTWMYRFTDFTVEQLMEQAELAADLGAEYFAVDAGWFGKGASWYNSVGDWSENMTGGLFGRMIELADKVRACGMKFGLWLEPERAAEGSDAVTNHREYFIKEGYNYFLDYSNEEAWRWMLGMICDLIDRYGIEYIKYDYNANMYHDVHGNAFLTYQEGHRKFVEALRERYPDIYLTGCAGGGSRMELGGYDKFDSFWPSDNESPYVKLRIYKDTLLRLPPQAVERWTAVHSLQGFEDFYKPFVGSILDQTTERLIACHDAVWNNVIGIHRSFLEAFMTCGPIGLSCDLKALSPWAKDNIRNFIAKAKENHAFWMEAVARILVNTPSVTVYQYSDMDLRRLEIQVVTLETLQHTIRVYPVVKEDKNYLVNGKDVISGAEIAREGILMDIPDRFEMFRVTLEETE